MTLPAPNPVRVEPGAVRQSMTAEHKAKMKAGRLRAASNGKSIAKPGKRRGISCLDAPQVGARMAQMPARYREQYRRAMSGKSLRAGASALCCECMGWEGLPDTVRNCTALACSLYPYRPYQEKANA
jgi:hypothetical protein